MTMGRITVFSIDDCIFCRRTKAALSVRGIPYAEIDIESHPSKRSDMISLTDQLTVPQIFFNSEHIGGSEEALATLAKWDEDIANNVDGFPDKTPRDRYIRLVESEPSSTDERLAIPEGNGSSRDMDFHRSRATEMFHVDEKSYTTPELTKLLIQKMPRNSLTYWACMYYNVFEGSAGVTALQKIFGLESREKAIKLGMKLQHKHYIGHVYRDHHVFGDNGDYFRLQPFHTPNVLNSFHVWCDPVDDKPMDVIHHLGKIWSKLESRHLNEHGMVDHATIRSDDFYWKFEEEVCAIQNISLEGMDDTTKMAFIINLYNLMIKYAFCKMGIPATRSNRASFFDDISINVGGSLFSFNDLEHGILRANTRHPYQLSRPFGIVDSRKHLALEKIDPRVHFALNCGARSCPPIKKYSAEAIEEELRLAAMAFCEQDSNVAINEENGQVHLNKIIYWYMSDFVVSRDKLPQKVYFYLRGEKQAKLNKLIQQGNATVKFFEYDWSSNDVNSNTFEKVDLSDKSIFPYSCKFPNQKYDLVQD